MTQLVGQDSPLLWVFSQDKGVVLTPADYEAVNTDWRDKVGDAQIGYPRDTTLEHPDFEYGPTRVLQWIRTDLRDWAKRWKQKNAPGYMNMIEHVIPQRLHRVLANHDIRFLGQILYDELHRAAKGQDDPFNKLITIVMVKAMTMEHPMLATACAADWTLSNTAPPSLMEKPPIYFCISTPSIAYLLETLLESSESRRAMLNCYRQIKAGILNQRHPVILALQAENFEAVQSLLEKCPDLFDEDVQKRIVPSVSDSDEADEDRSDIVRWIISRYPSMKTEPKYIKSALQAQNLSLVKVFCSKELLTSDSGFGIIEDLIRFEHLSTTELCQLEGFVEACTKIDRDHQRLCLAVEYRRVELVELLTQTRPKTPEENADDHEKSMSGFQKALKLNNEAGRLMSNFDQMSQLDAEALVREKIRNMIVKAVIYTYESEDIDTIMKKSESPSRCITIGDGRITQLTTPVDHYFFDLSHLRSHEFDIVHYSDCLLENSDQRQIHGKSNKRKQLRFYKDLQFESTLKYVEFPQLSSEPLDATVDHHEIEDILLWLGGKGVRKIIKLTVRDRRWGQHHEKRIAEMATQFGIEVLDWRCQDMSLTYLLTSVERFDNQCAADHLRELHLYSSGMPAVHRYWLSPESPINFTKLTTVILHIMRHSLPETRLSETEKDLETLKDGYLNARNTELVDAEPVDIQIKLEQEDPWNPLPEADPVQNTRSSIPRRLKNFLGKYRGLHDRVKATRIAILDTGIITTQGRASPNRQPPSKQSAPNTAKSRRSIQPYSQVLDRVAGGQSFIYTEEGRKREFYLATNAHGSQMAAIVCELDPLCELLIYKIGEQDNDIRADTVASAISWAIRQHVDIISMSFVCKADDAQRTDLIKALREAQKQNIWLLASHHDQGQTRANATPANEREVDAIAASDPLLGTAMYDADSSHYRYRLPGSFTITGHALTAESVTEIRGSSVATAIAAGLGSLTLSCYRYHKSINPPQAFNVISPNTHPTRFEETVDWRRDLIERAFGRMKPHDNDKFVAWEKFCALDDSDAFRPKPLDDLIGRWFSSIDPFPNSV